MCGEGQELQHWAQSQQWGWEGESWGARRSVRLFGTIQSRQVLRHFHPPYGGGLVAVRTVGSHNGPECESSLCFIRIRLGQVIWHLTEMGGVNSPAF